jgi:hypothetical protein
VLEQDVGGVDAGWSGTDDREAQLWQEIPLRVLGS